jgi:hypothetical protein
MQCEEKWPQIKFEKLRICVCQSLLDSDRDNKYFFHWHHDYDMLDSFFDKIASAVARTVCHPAHPNNTRGDLLVDRMYSTV